MEIVHLLRFSLGSLVASIALSSTAFATNYYVATNGSDSNPGTIDKPFSTLCIATLTMQPGDTVYMRGGTYRYTTRQTVRGGSAGAPKNVVAYPGETPILDLSYYAGTDDPFCASGAYIVIDGLDFRNSKRHGVSFYKVHDVTLRNCNFSNAKGSAIYFGYSALGYAYGLTVENCKATYCCQSNANPLNRTTWPPAISIDRASNVVISNSTVSNNYGEGIGIRCSKDVNISGNLVLDNFSVGIYLDDSSDLTVSSNYVYSTGDSRFLRDGRTMYGICLSHEAGPELGGLPLNNILITNNVITKTHVSFYYAGFGHTGGIQNVRFTRNTICYGYNYMLLAEADPAHSGNVFSNNIFYSAPTYNIQKNLSLPGFSFSANCWWGGVQSQRINGAGDIIADPKMASPGNNALSSYKLLADSPALKLQIGSLLP